MALCFTYLTNSVPQVLHGGLFSKDGVTLDDIRKIDRFREPPDSGIFNATARTHTWTFIVIHPWASSVTRSHVRNAVGRPYASGMERSLNRDFGNSYLRL